MQLAISSVAILLVLTVALAIRPSVLVIRDASVVNTRNGQVLQHRTVIVEGDRIRRVAPANDVTTSAHARVLDARDRWVLPRLIDMHVHGSSRPDVPLELYVANGVTAIRDLGGPLTPLQRVRQEAETGTRVAPRLYFVGPILDGSPPVAPSISIVVDTPSRALSAVNFLVDQHVDAIKVYNGITEPVLRAIVRAARDRHVPVVGHVPRAISASRAIQIGMDVIEHSLIRAVDLQAWGILTERDTKTIHAATSVTQREAMIWRHVDLKSRHVRTLIAQLAAGNTFLSPTLSIDEFDSLFLYPAQSSHPHNSFLPRSLVDETLGAEHQILKVLKDLEVAAREGVEKRRAFVNMSHRAGVRIVAGTDGPGIGSLAPGVGLHRELQLLVTSGLTPLHAIRAATFDAAAALRQEQNLGAVEDGKLADIVIFRADPRLNIANVAQIEAVVIRGQLFDRSMLDALLERVADRARGER
jgi:imidazolonepropionase-like amidohydrolase